MIILDTNVLSALMKPTPDPIVQNWLNRYDMELLWITSITVMEIQFGIHLLPDGKRKDTLQEAFQLMLRKRFVSLIIEFEMNAALAASQIAAALKSSGQNVDVRDIQIAGIASARGAYIATRNKRDFKHTGVEIINPWEEK